jgi:hypothetical protein
MRHRYAEPEFYETEVEQMPEGPEKDRIKTNLSYRKYEAKIRRTLGPRSNCPKCWSSRFYDIDWYNARVDCRICGECIVNLELIVHNLRELGEIR